MWTTKMRCISCKQCYWHHQAVPKTPSDSWRHRGGIILRKNHFTFLEYWVDWHHDKNYCCSQFGKGVIFNLNYYLSFEGINIAFFVWWQFDQMLNWSKALFLSSRGIYSAKRYLFTDECIFLQEKHAINNSVGTDELKQNERNEFANLNELIPVNQR